MTTRFLRAKRTAILGLCALGYAVPVWLHPITPVTANGNPPAIARGDLTNFEVRAKQIVEWLGTENFAKVIAAMSPKLKSFWNAEKLQRTWETQVIANTGPVRKILKTRAIDAINADIVTVTVEFEKHTEEVSLTFDTEGQIIGADFPEFRDIERIGATFIEDLAQKDYAAARGYLSPLLKAEIFPTRVQGAWENFLARVGPFERIVGTQVRKGSDVDGVDVLLVTVQFEKRTETLVLVFDDRKRIVNMDYPIDN